MVKFFSMKLFRKVSSDVVKCSFGNIQITKIALTSYSSNNVNLIFSTSIFSTNTVYSPRAVPKNLSWGEGGIKLACADINGRGRRKMGVANKIWRAL